jgi:hypothetical protein
MVISCRLLDEYRMYFNILKVRRAPWYLPVNIEKYGKILLNVRHLHLKCCAADRVSPSQPDR